MTCTKEITRPKNPILPRARCNVASLVTIEDENGVLESVVLVAVADTALTSPALAHIPKTLVVFAAAVAF